MCYLEIAEKQKHEGEKTVEVRAITYKDSEIEVTKFMVIEGTKRHISPEFKDIADIATFVIGETVSNIQKQQHKALPPYTLKTLLCKHRVASHLIFCLFNGVEEEVDWINICTDPPGFSLLELEVDPEKADYELVEKLHDEEQGHWGFFLIKEYAHPKKIDCKLVQKNGVKSVLTYIVIDIPSAAIQ